MVESGKPLSITGLPLVSSKGTSGCMPLAPASCVMARPKAPRPARTADLKLLSSLFMIRSFGHLCPHGRYPLTALAALLDRVTVITQRTPVHPAVLGMAGLALQRLLLGGNHVGLRPEHVGFLKAILAAVR